MPSLASPHLPVWIAQLACALFFAALFLQSGIDKVVDHRGNLGWLNEHFARSPLRGAVPGLLVAITLFELSAGVLSGVGVVELLVLGGARIAFWGAVMAGVSLLSLFFGQRLAKDYAGAAALVPYFLVALFALLLHGGRIR